MRRDRLAVEFGLRAPDRRSGQPRNDWPGNASQSLLPLRQRLARVAARSAQTVISPMRP